MKMAKNSISCTALPEEESVANHHHCHASASTMQLQDFATNAFQFQGSPGDSRATSPSQSHRQAEKRRRDRINAQLARLRKLIPKSDKMDKAALLERAVDQIKDLRRNTSEISKVLTIPTETDDITIECETKILQPPASSSLEEDSNNNNNNEVLIKASFSCEDRPDLISDLIRALKGLKLTTVGADMATLGGRIKTILILYHKHDSNGIDAFNVSAIKQSLMAVLTRVVSCSTGSNNFRVTSKRQRFFSPS